MTKSEVFRRLATVDQGMISDCMVRLRIGGWMDGLQALGGAASFAGPARTLLIAPRGGGGGLPMTKYAIMAALNPGDILVLGGIQTEENQMGDNVALFGQMHGIAAIVCDAPVRDSVGMSELTIPVFSRGRSARMPLTTEIVAFDGPIVCGGASVRAGDVIVGSKDGVLTLPSASIEDLLYQLDDLEAIEGKLQAAIRDGRSLREIEALASGKPKLRVRA